MGPNKTEIIRAAKREGQEGQFALGSEGASLLKIFDILTFGKYSEMHLSHFKRLDQKTFSLVRSQGASFRSFVPGPQKALRGPGNYIHGIF